MIINNYISGEKLGGYFFIGAGTGIIIFCFFSPNSTIRTVSIVVGIVMVCIGRYKKSKSDKMVFQYIEDHD